jgi:hypothetical protein
MNISAKKAFTFIDLVFLTIVSVFSQYASFYETKVKSTLYKQKDTTQHSRMEVDNFLNGVRNFRFLTWVLCMFTMCGVYAQCTK